MSDDATNRVHRPETVRWPRSADEWKAAVESASGRTHGPDPRSFAIAAGVCAGVVPLALVDTTLAAVGATPLLVAAAVLGTIAIGLCMFVLVTAYRRLDTDAPSVTSDSHWDTPVRRHLLVLLWSVAALAYGIEMMSAWAAVALGTSGGLSDARTFFLWHLARTLPVFTVTETLRLPRPTLSLDVAGVMALVLKVALILPLLRIAVAAFRLADGDERTDPRRSPLFTKRAVRRDPDTSEVDPMRSARRSVWIVVCCGALLGLLLTICNWVLPVTRQVASALPGTSGRWVRSLGDGIVDILGFWIVQAIVLVVLSIVLLLSTAAIVIQLLRVDVGATFRVTVGLTVLFASLVSLVLVFSTAVAVDLTITCFAQQRPPMIEAFGHLEWYAWHSLNVLPELTVPDVLQWSQPKDPQDIGRGVMLLFVKLVAVLVIAVPVARVVRAARETWPSRVV